MTISSTMIHQVKPKHLNAIWVVKRLRRNKDPKLFVFGFFLALWKLDLIHSWSTETHYRIACERIARLAKRLAGRRGKPFQKEYVRRVHT